MHFGKNCIATATGAAWKVVQCEYCNTPYVYLLRGAGTGDAGAVFYEDKAEADAVAETNAIDAMRNNLESGCALCRCTNCGQFQHEMIKVARKEREPVAIRRGVKLALVPVFGFALAACVFTDQLDLLLMAMATSAVLGFALVICWGFAIRFLYDPNKRRVFLMPPDPHVASSAMTVEDFKRQSAHEPDEYCPELEETGMVRPQISKD